MCVRTFRAEVDIRNAREILVSGMCVTLAFDLESRGLVQVPARALVSSARGSEVAVVDDRDPVQLHDVAIARDDGNVFEISSGAVDGRQDRPQHERPDCQGRQSDCRQGRGGDRQRRQSGGECPAAGWRHRGAIAICAALAGCTVGPDYHAPAISMPAQFAAVTMRGAPPPSETKPGAPPAAELQSWWRALGDRELDALVDRAITANLDIELALARLQEARTEEAVVVGEALPELAASGGAGLGTGSDLTRGRTTNALHSADNATHRRIRSVVGFEAGWELDLFGMYRREIEAAKDDAEAAEAARSAVLVSVVADVARAYVDLRGLQMQLSVMERNVDVARSTLKLTETRFERGLTNEFDVALARRELATLEAEVPPLGAAISAAQDTLAVLMGQFPGDLPQDLMQPAMIPQLPTAIEPGLPLDLLRRRPDIREAERQLAGATARIGVATANLFPQLALTGAVGYQGRELPSSGIWSAGPTAYWSLLDFGTLDAMVDIADLQTHENLVQYKETILLAVQDVDTAIAAYRAQQVRLTRLSEALSASDRAVTLASQRYDRGLTDFLNVLDAQREEYYLETQYVVAQQAAAEELVALYKGLGGGWEDHQVIPPIRTPQPAVIAAFRRLLVPEDPAK
jgi:NodT family efflux transporter outer membrane factor (OMF) lipoprotein